MSGISTTVTGSAEALQNLSGRVARLEAALYRKIFSLCTQVQSKIQGNLAAGIGLKSRTGTSGLAGSVIVIEPKQVGTVITGEVTSASRSGLFFYGGMWEFTGHKEIVPVTKKALHFFAGGKSVFAMRVSAQAPRPWMLPPFREMRPYIAEQIRQTVITTP